MSLFPAATGGGFPFLQAGVDSHLTPWFGTLRRGSNTAVSASSWDMRGPLPHSWLLVSARRWQSEDTATRTPCQSWTHLCPGCPCPSGSQYSQFSLFQQQEGRAAHAGGLGTAMCHLSCLLQLLCFLPANQLDQWARTGAQPRCSEAAVSPGEEGTGRTCQAPAHTRLCSSGLQPGITESSSCGKTPGHGSPDR